MAQLYLEYSYDHGYSFSRKRKKIKSLDALLSTKLRSAAALVTTDIGRWPRKQCVLVLDCDNQENLLAATHWIKTELGLGYAPINSSPGRFWVVTDYVGPVRKAVEMLLQIPGVDEKFTTFVSLTHRFWLRCHPRIIGDTIVNPVFPDTNDLTNPLAIAWYDSFRSLYMSNDYRKILKKIVLNQAIKDGRILELATDPQFIV